MLFQNFFFQELIPLSIISFTPNTGAKGYTLLSGLGLSGYFKRMVYQAKIRKFMAHPEVKIAVNSQQ